MSETETASPSAPINVPTILYGTPQLTRKRQARVLRPRRMTLIDLRSTPLNNEDSSGSPRKSSFGTIRSENAALSQLHTHTRPPEISEPIQQVRRPSVSTNMRNKQISPPAQPSSSSNANVSSHCQGHIRFPKLEEYAHFHYDVVEIPSLKVSLCDDDNVGYKHNVDVAGPDGLEMFLVSVTGTAPKSWMIRRSLANFAMLDRQLHSCIFDRKFSHLADLDTAQLERKTSQEVRSILHTYLNHLSDLAGGMVNCGSVLSWMEMDNRGHRLVATDDSGINTPAIAAAHVVKRYTAQAADEISLQVGDMISVIDMPPGDDTMWWRGKRGFEVGFFPSECVEVIKDKVPSSMASRITEPLATTAASRKPCESLDGESISMTSQTLSCSSLPSSSSFPVVTAATLPTVSAPVAMATLPRCAATFPLPLSGSSFDSSPTIPGPKTFYKQPNSIVKKKTSFPNHTENGSKRCAFPKKIQEAKFQPMDTKYDTDVMRKHGKLMSFLRTFFSQRPPRNQLKQSGIVKERVFGCDLGEHLLNSGHDVPLLLKSCTEIIEKYGIVHGIYRLSGITSNIQKLRLAFDEDRVPDLTEECYLQDIHSISSLLKMYFRELPNPLLTYQLYDKFADAVRDEDNKLLKIHDVVQQLPPPHYRTTEFLMRHLACVAAFGQETEMHSKNLAIVWAPNLLRSKELEAGGGAAALQGVGIQAVVTECLICYCDIIFSDKMPNYGLQDGLKGQKKPRPKSLAISTPTRLLSLEEARERAIGSLASCQKFIDVGGGPKNLPSKYHTVLDVQGYKKKASNKEKENKPTQGKKSPSMAGRSTNAGGGGWKSIFTKPRAGSVKKARKGSGQDNVSLSPIQAKALTEEDVHNWKRNLRSAKSAESLFSMSATPSSNSSLGSRSSRSNVENGEYLTPILGRDSETMKGKRILSHKRSLSSDASAILHNRFVSQDSRGLHTPMDADEDFDGNPKKQSFVRGDSTRKALHHRRVPSAPSTPLENRKSNRQGACSSLKGDHSGGEDMDISFDDFVYPKSESRGDVNIDAAIKSRLQQVADKNRKSNDDVTSSSSPMKRCAKTPPKGRKKVKGLESRQQRVQDDEKFQPVPQQLSPQKHEGQSIEKSPHDVDDPESRMRLIYSRLHDYAEIASDEDALNTPSSQGTMSMSSSGCNMQDVLDQIDSRLAMNATYFSRLGTVESGTNANYQNYSVLQDPSSAFSTPCKETEILVTDSNSPACPSTETEFHASLSSSPHEVSSHSFTNTFTTESVSQASQGFTVNEKYANAQRNVSSLSESKNVISSNNTSPNEGFSTSHIYHRRVDPNSSSSSGSGKFTRVLRRRAEFIPSSNAASDLDDLLDCLEVHNNQRRQSSKRGLEKRLPSSKSTSLSSSPSHRPPQHHYHHHAMHHQVCQEHLDSTKPPKSPSVDSKISALGVKGQSQMELAQGHPGMSKCLSVPSDIARSLENVTGSQSDILSSVTISELSMSRNSFSNGIADMRPAPSCRAIDPRQRRSSSLDSLNENDRLLSRTLREINQQMEAAFKHTPSDPLNVEQSTSFGAMLQRHRQHSPRLVSSDLDLSNIRPESIDPLEKETNTKAIISATYIPEVAKDLGSPSSHHHCSDQTLTPTQNPMVDHYSGLSSPPRKHSPLNESLMHEKHSTSSAAIKQSILTDSDLDDDSPAFITDNPEMEVCRNLTLAEAMTIHVHEFFPTSDSPTSPPSHVQNPLYDFPSSMSSIENNFSPPQKEKQMDDLTVIEPLSSAVHFSRSKDMQRKLNDQKTPISVVRSPSDLVSFDRKEASSTSSEDFDEVASASSDDDGVENVVSASFLSGKVETCHSGPKPSIQSQKPSGGAKRDFSLPLTYKTDMKEDDDVMDNRWIDPWRRANDGQAGGCSMASLSHSKPESPVVIRRHSPYAEQRSSLVDRSFSPSDLQSPSSGLINSGGSGLPNFDSDDESVFNWKNNSLFSSTGNEGEEENAERMLSLRAAGLASQRARLSRESSNSSLQSPDVSYSSIVPGTVRSPQIIPVLPDIVQSTTTSVRSISTDDMSHSNVPLQLALYHPDEFAMNIQAAIVGPSASLPTMPSSSSLPQVHTSTDTVVMKKSTLKKSSTDNAIFNEVGDMPLSDLRASRGRGTKMIGNINLTTSSSPKEDRHDKQVSRCTASSTNSPPIIRTCTESDNVEDKSAPLKTKSKQSGGSGLNQNSHLYPGVCQSIPALDLSEENVHDQVAMEVDNLCNKLVDDLNSPCSPEAPTEIPSEESITVLAFHDVRTEQDEQGEISMELETTMEVKSSQPSSPLVRERRIIRSCNDDRHNMETRLVSVQHPNEGDVDGEAVQNVLNAGREILMQPDQTQVSESQDVSNEKAPRPFVTAACNMANSNATYMSTRKTSFSKIPRPRTNTDFSSKTTSRLVCPVVSTSSRNRCPESNASSSLYTSSTGSSPSSSSSSSSSRTSYSHSRRASETGSMSAQMARKSNHSRRSSDTRLSDLKSDSSPTTRQSSLTLSSASSPRCAYGSRMKSSVSNSKHITVPDNTVRSRIPLSHRVPIPQSNEKDNLSPNMSRSTRHQFQTQQPRKTTSPCAKPRKLSRSSLKSDPCLEETSEVTLAAVGKSEHSEPSRRHSMKKDGDSLKHVVVKDLDDDGGAKLVIEIQPELKKKIQTVHAKKVPLPSRQVAESLETDPTRGPLDSGMVNLNPTVPSDTIVSDPSKETSDHLSNAHKEEKENKTPPPVPARKFGYDSLSLPRPNKQKMAQANLSSQQGTKENYSEMIGSRSSLDDSVLQLAAERQQIFIPCSDRDQDSYGYSTGSLRVKRSQRLQSLVDLFEKGTESNVSDSPGSSPSTRHRTYSASSTFTHVEYSSTCVESHSLNVDSQGNSRVAVFHPPSSFDNQLPQTSIDIKAREQERYPQRRSVNSLETDYDNLSSESDRKEGTHCGKEAEPRPRVISQRVPPEAAKRSTSLMSSSASAAVAVSSPPTAPKSLRPPRYQTSRARTQSESSASESDSAHQSDSNAACYNLTKDSASISSSVVPRYRTSSQSDTPPTSPKEERHSERRGSIKELRLLFEKSSNEQDVTCMTPPSTTPPQLRQRIRSVSPPAEVCESRQERVNLMRLSLEIPSGSSGLPAGSHFDFKAHPVRLGPKPFYSMNK